LVGVYEATRAERDRRRYSPDAFWISGLETLASGERYSWDGLRRGVDPARPCVIFQATLAGHGRYESTEAAGGAERIDAGRAFVAVVPGPHRYYLPDDATDGWTFFWLMLRHPYVVARIAERQRLTGAGMAATVLELAPESGLLARAVALFADGFTNVFDEEAACFAFLTEFERHVHLSTSAVADSEKDDERDSLLARARALFQSDPTRPVGVADLARAESMSRTRYSHHFKAVTGQPPAHYIARIRLEEVARRLAQTDATLARIASETGFADANHLCKAFRRRFHLSPGAYRRQMR
jgi:AraC-like DNA-binding protein